MRNLHSVCLSIVLFCLVGSIYAQSHNFQFDFGGLLTGNRIVGQDPNVPKSAPVCPGFYLGTAANMRTDKQFGWSVGFSFMNQQVDQLIYTIYNVTIDPNGQLNPDGNFGYEQQDMVYFSPLISGRYSFLQKGSLTGGIEAGGSPSVLLFAGDNNKIVTPDKVYTSLNIFASFCLERKLSNGCSIGLKLPYLLYALNPRQTLNASSAAWGKINLYSYSIGIGCFFKTPDKARAK